MLSKVDNELLTRVGPGTAMGDMLRQYWHPILVASELPERDGQPLRVKLLGEDLIAFRDSGGRIGLVANHCPHRGASLFFGRNEEDGLRCVYHGWKFDVSGACVDMPNEPAESNFKNKVRIVAYPCVERNGVIWAYLGPEEQPPAPPAFEWNLVPDTHRYITKRLEHCNWAQALEGGIDTSHSSFLHRRMRVEDYGGNPIVYTSRAPRFEVVDTDYGVLVGARRELDADTYIWGITPFLMPYYTMITRVTGAPTMGGHAWVPMDDHTTMAWTVSWNPLRPLTEAELDSYQHGFTIHVPVDLYRPADSSPGGAWRPEQRGENDYLLDRTLEKDRYFTGIHGIGMQDAAMQESMGSIYDRTKEHLGSADGAIIRVRQLWLRSARALREAGTAPVGSHAPDAYRVRSAGVKLAKDSTASWVDAAKERAVAHPGSYHEVPWEDAVTGEPTYV